MPEPACVELRQYTLHPGTRDVLIDLFDREFVESQEALGMSVMGQFRDLDDPNRFVWLRGFPDMRSRARALADFYGGPVWKAHCDVANATMIAWDDVRLLRPARAGSGFSFDPGSRPPPGAAELSKAVVVATVYDLEAPPDAGFVDFFEGEVRPVVEGEGASIVATFVTEGAPNNYPPLPVREGENVLAWFARFEDATAYEQHVAALARSRRWNQTSGELAERVKAPPEIRRLSPTARSLVR